jgi:hypothetical protein
MSGGELNLSFVPRFNVGLMVDFTLTSELSVKSGLLFTTKGAKYNQFMGLNMLVEYNVAYAELPLSLQYIVTLQNGHLLFGFGPYASYGIVGSAVYTLANSTVNEKIEFTNEYESINPLNVNKINPFDYGGNLSFGYEFNGGILLQFSMQVGMAKINAENRLISSNAIFKNRGYGLSIEYKF